VIRAGFGVFYDLATGQATRGYASFPFNSVTPLTRVPFIPGSAAINGDSIGSVQRFHRRRFNARLQPALHVRRAALDAVRRQTSILGRRFVGDNKNVGKLKIKIRLSPFVTDNSFSFSKTLVS
jgi:hypothetical protein